MKIKLWLVFLVYIVLMGGVYSSTRLVYLTGVKNGRTQIKELIAFTTGENRQDIIDEIAMEQYSKLSKSEQLELAKDALEYAKKSKGVFYTNTQKELTDFAYQQKAFYKKKTH